MLQWLKKISVWLAAVSLSLLTSIAAQANSAYSGQATPVNQPMLYDTHPDFPAQVGHFTRRKIIAFNGKQPRFSVAYELNDRWLKASAIFYMYSSKPYATNHSVATLKRHYQQLKKAIEYRHPEAKVLREVNIMVPQNGREIRGQRIVFELNEIFDGRRQTVYSELYVFLHNNRYVTFRSLYPSHQAKDVQRQVDFLLLTLNWADTPVDVLM